MVDQSLEGENEQSLSELELRRVLQKGLPLVARPYQHIAQQLGTNEQAVIEKIAELQQRGLIKRFGMILRHHELGYTANCMIVWDLSLIHISEPTRPY